MRENALQRVQADMAMLIIVSTAQGVNQVARGAYNQLTTIHRTGSCLYEVGRSSDGDGTNMDDRNVVMCAWVRLSGTCSGVWMRATHTLTALHDEKEVPDTVAVEL